MNSLFSSYVTSRVNNLRQNLLSNENDGETVNETHICRVLRAYYTEKGRNFPKWLPPDPKAPQQAPQEMVSTSSVGQNYGGGVNPAAKTEFSSLWSKSQQPGQPPAQPSSLRSQRGGAAQRPNPFAAKQPTQQQAEPRPLPSQKPGSYQIAGPRSKNDRLSERIGSGRSQSPSVSPQVYSNYAGGNNGEGYGERSRSVETSSRSNRRGGSTEETFVGATEPWMSDASGFRGDGYNAGSNRSGGYHNENRRGLPDNPRQMHR